MGEIFEPPGVSEDFDCRFAVYRGKQTFTFQKCKCGLHYFLKSFCEIQKKRTHIAKPPIFV